MLIYKLVEVEVYFVIILYSVFVKGLGTFNLTLIHKARDARVALRLSRTSCDRFVSGDISAVNSHVGNP